jgi:hypothetical protein
LIVADQVLLSLRQYGSRIIEGSVDCGKRFNLPVDCCLSFPCCVGDSLFLDGKLSQSRVESTLAIEMTLDDAFGFLIGSLFASR